MPWEYKQGELEGNIEEQRRERGHQSSSPRLLSAASGTVLILRMPEHQRTALFQSPKENKTKKINSKNQSRSTVSPPRTPANKKARKKINSINI
jgi:hypothetical protein